MDEIEAFVDECRADPWFQSHPEVVDAACTQPEDELADIKSDI
jgi:hypothetical protein